MVSIVIAAYNTEKYIAKCLESLKKQTYTDFEAIVVVDGATDKTLEICEEFSNGTTALSRFIKKTAVFRRREITDLKSVGRNT